jgi:hypothetical protein
VGLLRDLAELIQSFMRSSPALPAMLIYLVVAAVPITLVHELGHALVAARRLRGPIHVCVGSTGQLLRVRVRHLTLAVSAVTHPGHVGGTTTFDAARATARDVTLIALAGPGASLLGFAVAAVAFSSAPAGGVAHDLLWAATAGSVVAVLNILPFEFQERRGGPRLRTDGRIALEAARARRALR